MDHQIPNFLGLPREIRDEVYKYLLLFDLPTKGVSSTPLTAVLAQHDKPVSVQNAILRVNKQVHDEAAEIFYGLNTFVVKITSLTYSGLPDRPHHKFQRFNLVYIAPWESLTFDCRARSPWEELVHGLGIRLPEFAFEEAEMESIDVPWGYNYSETIDLSFERDIYSAKLLHENEARNLKLPGTRYRHLVRRINLDIESQHPLLEASNEFCYSTGYLRLTLFPALSRLENSLYDKGKDVQVDVKVSALILEENWEKKATSVMLEEDLGRRFQIKKALERKMYTALCRLLWPLTRMSWKSSRISTPLDSQYPSVMEGEFERCRTFKVEAAEEFNSQTHQLPEEIVTASVGHMWAFVRGRLGLLAIDRCVRAGLLPDVLIFEPEDEPVYSEFGPSG
ncbi:uncharacterized protein DFL_000530 [Arthrobotrys flagrans]|uniref:F-box domain-containing protein n=1 Tax=Arthrobotrys flagrans TaxID=97331 RepID=A0A437AEJ6_ARTFL|nr:hypothetical protein DFL_000530 [Arthrobotrys flagrans]